MIFMEEAIAKLHPVFWFYFYIPVWCFSHWIPHGDPEGPAKATFQSGWNVP